MPSTVLSRLEVAKNELLDLSFRNPLLGFRPLKSRGLEFVGADLPVVWAALQSEKSLRMFCQGSKAMSGVLLRTDYPPEELDKRTLKTFYDARTGLEEQGVNTLFLAFGFLRWFEDDSSEVARRSPLFLLPVELKREANREFVLRWTGEEAGANLSLEALLKRDFGLELPDLPEDDFDLLAYFDSVRDAVRALPRFEIEDTLSLAFFSYSKFLMFRDLETHAEGAQNHPLISAVLGEGFREAPSRFGENERLDDLLPPSQSQTVTDADSSQLVAIEDVKAGRTLVVQGPPGTGKSQTITNIIAGALAQGKTVLFVAEKLAALEVVKRRLDRLGLGAACLELHSNKTNKKAFLGELKATFEAAPPAPPRDEELPRLENALRALNAHAGALNTPLEASGLSLFQAQGRWLRLERQIEAQQLKLPRWNAPPLAQLNSTEVAHRQAVVATLAGVIGRIGAPCDHPFFGAKVSSFLPSDVQSLRLLLGEAREWLRQTRSHLAALAGELSLPVPGDFAAARGVLGAAREWKNAPDVSGLDLQNPRWQSGRNDWQTLLQSAVALGSLRREWENVLAPSAWTSDVSAVRLSLEKHGRKWWRVFHPAWRAAQVQMRALVVGAPPKDTDGQLRLVAAIEEFGRARTEFARTRELGQTLCGARWRDLDSDFASLERAGAWIEACHQKQRDGQLSPLFFARGAAPNLADLPETERAHEALERALRDTETLLAWPRALTSDSFDELEARCARWDENAERVGEIVALDSACAPLQSAGLGDLFDIALDWPDAPRGLAMLFERAWLDAVTRAGMERFPWLAAFDGSAHERTVGEFAARDLSLLQNNARRIARKHLASLPQGDDAHHEKGLKLLRHEWNKQRAHLAPRRLVERAGPTIQAIKPVWMMSPLSVATFLPGQLEFDLVIFDEASQVRPADALGALFRAGQAVVAGDSKQLPPTQFFDRLASDEEDEDEDESATDLESILGAFVAQGAPQRMLRWHYRSRHESLIAVSNREFYDEKLVIFPSPDAARERLGLVCHLLENTVYRASLNREEAKAVAGAVLRFAREQLGRDPKDRQTLGVAAFSIKQAGEISDQLEILRRGNPELEPFFAPEEGEPFFVKNLENVQGDERDVMFLSVSYGRDENGKTSMNFGPLNRPGGERRLNVLITRARLRCEVFSNLHADDIDLSKTNSVGVRALKQFLSYAQSGAFVQAVPTGRDADSPFEVEVIETIRALGFSAVPQVGCAGYFLDMAVQDPARPGRFILGIECDGATYHSARSARDRDRLRAQVLEGMGWKLHRIWSTDWFLQRATQTQKLKVAIEAAVQTANSGGVEMTQSATEKNSPQRRGDAEKMQGH